MARRAAIAAPRMEDISKPVHEVELRLNLKVVTPILGGAPRTRTIDEVDIVRAPGIRGQLRYWWRALHGHRHGDPASLYEAESSLWGGVAQADGSAPSGPRRSRVSVRVRVEASGKKDPSDILLQAVGAYALFPARAEKERGQIVKPPAPRRSPGTRFELVLRWPAGCPRSEEIKTTVAAWVLLGGIGGRTRRGLGALEPLEGMEGLLGGRTPKEFLEKLCSPSGIGLKSRDFPALRGASTFLSPRGSNALDCWAVALGWVSAFRQKAGLAREPSADPKRPGQSRWPEPDLVRRAAGARVGEPKFAHTVRYGGNVAFPRAQFGLPIVSRWQNKDRAGQIYQPPEPKQGFELNLHGYERLASPLIVKPFWLGKDAWASLALWLPRKDPEAHVVIRGYEHTPYTARFSAMPSGATHPALQGRDSVRAAFFAWLESTQGKVTT